MHGRPVRLVQVLLAALSLQLVAAVGTQESRVDVWVRPAEWTIHHGSTLYADATVSTAHDRRLTDVTAYVRPPGPPGVAPDRVELEVTFEGGVMDGASERMDLRLDNTRQLHAGHNLLCVEATDNLGDTGKRCADFHLTGHRVSGFGNVDADDGLDGSFAVLASHGANAKGELSYDAGLLGYEFRSTEVEQVEVDAGADPATGLVRGEGEVNGQLDCDFELRVTAGGLNDGRGRFDLHTSCGPLNLITHDISGDIEGFMHVTTTER